MLNGRWANLIGGKTPGNAGLWPARGRDARAPSVINQLNPAPLNDLKDGEFLLGALAGARSATGNPKPCNYHPRNPSSQKHNPHERALARTMFYKFEQRGAQQPLRQDRGRPMSLIEPASILLRMPSANACTSRTPWAPAPNACS